jgi:hypothetical protein
MRSTNMSKKTALIFVIALALVAWSTAGSQGISSGLDAFQSPIHTPTPQPPPET